MLISKKLTLIVALWTIFALFITGDTNLEIFLILLLIGFVVIREFSDRFITTNLKQKLNIFILGFLIVFVVIIVEKIINEWSI